jgi:hypothetical protein
MHRSFEPRAVKCQRAMQVWSRRALRRLNLIYNRAIMKSRFGLEAPTRGWTSAFGALRKIN